MRLGAVQKAGDLFHRQQLEVCHVIAPLQILASEDFPQDKAGSICKDLERLQKAIEGDGATAQETV